MKLYRKIIQILPNSLKKILKKLADKIIYYIWIKKGRLSPPPHVVKLEIIRKYSKKEGTRVLVETGTYFGDTIDSLKDEYDRIYSIELDKKLYLSAKKNFKRYKNIKIINGNSALVLRELVKKLPQKVLFWLDAHYSGSGTAKGNRLTPIMAELTALLGVKGKNWIILIDDARLFNGEGDYPKLSILKKFIKSIDKSVKIAVVDDVIRLT